MQPTHLAYSDESRYTDGRFRALAVVSLPSANLAPFDTELRHLLDSSGVREMSWRKVTGARGRYVATKALDWVVRHADDQLFRADVLTWDTHDSRHQVRHRDDIENMHRMYHHLLHSVLAARWPDDAIWEVRPDENTAMTWERMASFLRLTERKRSDALTLIDAPRRNFYLLRLHEVSSADEPLVQIADVLAGVGAFSRVKYQEYMAWHRKQDAQQSLWDDEPGGGWSGSDLERFSVLRSFSHQCRRSELRVSLEGRGGLRTEYPGSPLNFWWYEPRHEDDRAPTRVHRD